MIPANEANKTATAIAKAKRTRDEAARKRKEKAEKAAHKKAVASSIKWHRTRVEEAIAAAVNKGRKSESYRFNDTKVDDEAILPVIEELKANGYAVESHFGSYEFKGSDESPTDTIYYGELSIKW